MGAVARGRGRGDAAVRGRARAARGGGGRGAGGGAAAAAGAQQLPLCPMHGQPVVSLTSSTAANPGKLGGGGSAWPGRVVRSGRLVAGFGFYPITLKKTQVWLRGRLRGE